MLIMRVTMHELSWKKNQGYCVSIVLPKLTKYDSSDVAQNFRDYAY